MGQFLFGLQPYIGEPGGVDGFFLGFDWPLMILSIFLFNVVLSGFVFVTLPGLVFFPLSVVALVVRAVLWGVLLIQVPTSVLWFALPTLVLEGEGYVLAAFGGVSLGVSWLRPQWMFEGENMSRSESLKRSLMEVARIYVLVAVLLLVAAVVETVTILSS